MAPEYGGRLPVSSSFARVFLRFSDLLCCDFWLCTQARHVARLWLWFQGTKLAIVTVIAMARIVFAGSAWPKWEGSRPVTRHSTVFRRIYRSRCTQHRPFARSTGPTPDHGGMVHSLVSTACLQCGHSGASGPSPDPGPRGQLWRGEPSRRGGLSGRGDAGDGEPANGTNSGGTAQSGTPAGARCLHALWHPECSGAQSVLH